MTYDHTDADVPMMRTRTVIQAQRELDAMWQIFSGETVHGAVGYDENGDHYAVSYPPRGMRCS